MENPNKITRRQLLKTLIGAAVPIALPLLASKNPHEIEGQSTGSTESVTYQDIELIPHEPRGATINGFHSITFDIDLSENNDYVIFTLGDVDEDGHLVSPGGVQMHIYKREGDNGKIDFYTLGNNGLVNWLTFISSTNLSGINRSPLSIEIVKNDKQYRLNLGEQTDLGRPIADIFYVEETLESPTRFRYENMSQRNLELTNLTITTESTTSYRES